MIGLAASTSPIHRRCSRVTRLACCVKSRTTVSDVPLLMPTLTMTTTVGRSTFAGSAVPATRSSTARCRRAVGDVVGLYRRFGIKLKPLGDGWVTSRCFSGRHKDRHPSARVHLRSGGFRCFTCGAAGGVLDALQLLGAYDRDEARQLAEDYGVIDRPRPRRTRPPPAASSPRPAPAPTPPPLPPPTPPPPVPVPRARAPEVGEPIDWDNLADTRAEVVHDRTWTYVDRSGSPVGRVRRLDLADGQKRIWQERPEKGGWVGGLDGAHLPLYQLPHVLGEAAAGRRVLVVEGEKAVDALARVGHFATTNAGGAGKWRDEHTAAMRGAVALVVCDSDGPGRLHALEVSGALLEAGVEVLMPLDPAPLRRDGYDVVDLLVAVAATSRALAPEIASAELRMTLRRHIQKLIAGQLPADSVELQRWYEYADFLTNPGARMHLDCSRCGEKRVHYVTHGIAYCKCGAHQLAPVLTAV